MGEADTIITIINVIIHSSLERRQFTRLRGPLLIHQVSVSSMRHYNDDVNGKLQVIMDDGKFHYEN